jgi:hypothetical protein
VPDLAEEPPAGEPLVVGEDRGANHDARSISWSSVTGSQGTALLHRPPADSRANALSRREQQAPLILTRQLTDPLAHRS